MISEFGDSTETLMEELKNNRKAIKLRYSENFQNEKLLKLEEIFDFEESKGQFNFIPNSIDHRSSNLKDIELPSPYSSACGIKGGKLSLG